MHQGCVACGQQNKVEPKAPLHPIAVSFPLEVKGITKVKQHLLVMAALSR